MTDDLVKRLRDDFDADYKKLDPDDVIGDYEAERHEAASRIERLEKALRRCTYECENTDCDGYWIAAAALDGKDD